MTERRQALMIGNGALVLFVGLLSGYAYMFHLIGEITLWPIPGSIDLAVGTDSTRWRAAHSGNIMNALMVIGAGLALPKLRLSDGAEKFVTWVLILTIWGNVGFYTFSALGAANRGLTMGANRLGDSDVLGTLAFLIGYPGAFLAPVAILLLARGAFAAARTG